MNQTLIPRIKPDSCMNWDLISYKTGIRGIAGVKRKAEILTMKFFLDKGEGFEQPYERNFNELRMFDNEEYREFAQAKEEVRTTAGLCLLIKSQDKDSNEKTRKVTYARIIPP